MSFLMPLRRAVLFGSYASDRFDAASDIDLMVIYEGERRDGAFETLKRAMTLVGVEPHVYSEVEALQAAAVIQRMTEGGVVVYPEIKWLS